MPLVLFAQARAGDLDTSASDHYWLGNSTFTSLGFRVVTRRACAKLCGVA
jgi:hypothetical protein